MPTTRFSSRIDAVCDITVLKSAPTGALVLGAVAAPSSSSARDRLTALPASNRRAAPLLPRPSARAGWRRTVGLPAYRGASPLRECVRVWWGNDVMAWQQGSEQFAVHAPKGIA
jgi:hypothetical protein